MGVVVCQYCASVFEGIVDVTGVLRLEPTHRFLGSLACRVIRLTGKGFTK